MILAIQAGFRNLDASLTQSRQEKTDVTQFLVSCYTHVKSDGITKLDFGPEEKNLVEKGRKMVQNGETGSEITKAHPWTQYKPNIFSSAAPVLTLHIVEVYEIIPQAGRGPGVKKWTVIGGRRGRFWWQWQCRRSLRYDFESLTTRRLQRRLEFAPTYRERFVSNLPTRSERRWSRTEGPSGREPIGPPPTMPRFTIHKAISSVFAQVRWNEHLPWVLKISDPDQAIVTFIQT